MEIFVDILWCQISIWASFCMIPKINYIRPLTRDIDPHMNINSKNNNQLYTSFDQKTT